MAGVRRREIGLMARCIILRGEAHLHGEWRLSLLSQDRRWACSTLALACRGQCYFKRVYGVIIRVFINWATQVHFSREELRLPGSYQRHHRFLELYDDSSPWLQPWMESRFAPIIYVTWETTCTLITELSLRENGHTDETTSALSNAGAQIINHRLRGNKIMNLDVGASLSNRLSPRPAEMKQLTGVWIYLNSSIWRKELSLIQWLRQQNRSDDRGMPSWRKLWRGGTSGEEYWLACWWWSISLEWELHSVELCWTDFYPVIPPRWEGQ